MAGHSPAVAPAGMAFAICSRCGAVCGPADPAQAVDFLFNELGGHTVVEKENGAFLIRSFGCPLSAVTFEHPEACNAVESLLGEFTRLDVSKCCDREERLRCCFTLRELPSRPRARATSSTRQDRASARR